MLAALITYVCNLKNAKLPNSKSCNQKRKYKISHQKFFLLPTVVTVFKGGNQGREENLSPRDHYVIIVKARSSEFHSGLYYQKIGRALIAPIKSYFFSFLQCTPNGRMH